MSKSCWVCAISRPGVWTSHTGQTGCVTSFSHSRHSCTWTVYISTGQNGARLIKMTGEEIGLQPRSKVILSQCSTEFWHDIFRSFSSLHFSCARKNLSCQSNVAPISEAWLTLLQTSQVSRFCRETHDFQLNLTVSRYATKISRFLENLTFFKENLPFFSLPKS